MKDYIFNRKVTRIIMQLAEVLNISPVRALCIFYESETGKMMHNPLLGLHLMSDTYIVNDVISELKDLDSNPKI